MELIKGHVSSLASSIRDNPTISSTASIFIAILVGSYFIYQNQFKYFTKLGLKSPKPLPVFGNALDFFREDYNIKERQRARECGKFYGTYQGLDPRFVVADAELLRQISIKEFDKFPNHEVSRLFNDYQKRFIFFLEDDDWKRVRALQSPTFTSGKIKRMYKLLDVCADDLVQCFGEQLGGETAQKGSESAVINAKDIFSLYTMDGIASCAYGLKLRREGSSSLKSVASRNEFVNIALKLFKFNPARILVLLTISERLLRLINFTASPMSTFEPLATKLKLIIESRRESGRKFDDYLQILLDARLDAKIELNEMDAEENHHAGLSHDSLLADQKRMLDQLKDTVSVSDDVQHSAKSITDKAGMSDDEILSGAMFLMAVGLETTATLLTHCTYALAFHQDIQEKLFSEINKIVRFKDGTSEHAFNYDALTSCNYLDSVLSETLRALSPVLITNRVAKEDYYVARYGVTIPKDGKVNLALHAIMNDPDYWPEPEKFDPERFMPGQREKIVPGSYCPFGIGPRHCLGMRFSLTEAKLGLAKLMMKYKFEPAPGTVYPPRSKAGGGLYSIKDPRVVMKPI